MSESDQEFWARMIRLYQENERNSAHLQVLTIAAIAVVVIGFMAYVLIRWSAP